MILDKVIILLFTTGQKIDLYLINSGLAGIEYLLSNHLSKLTFKHAADA